MAHSCGDSRTTMATSSHQLFLLADHIKLTLLERQRAASLSLPTTAQTSQISRSLESLRDGLAALGRQKFDQEAAGEDISDLASQIARLQSQYEDLEADFSISSPSGLYDLLYT